MNLISFINNRVMLKITKASKKCVYKISKKIDTTPVSASDKIKEILQYLHTLKPIRKNLTFTNKTLPMDLLDSSFIALDIKTYIIANTFKSTMFNKIHVFGEETIIDKVDFDFLQDTCFKIIELFQFLSSKRALPNIYLLLSPFTKLLPETGSPLLPENVNSGYTDRDANIIFIWRSEEMIKVLIHELVHYFGFDGFLMHDFNKYFDKFQISDRKQIKIYESYTESLTTHLNILIAISDLPVSIDKQCNMYSYLLNIETQYATYQTAKILKHFGFTNFKQFITDSKKLVLQKTAVFSYYIVRCIVMYTLTFDDLINETIPKQYLEKVLKGFDDKVFVNRINDLLKDETLLKSRSLKMQCIEMNVFVEA